MQLSSHHCQLSSSVLQASYSSNKINTFRPSEILNIKNRTKYLVGKYCNIQNPNRIIVIICSVFCCKAVPFTIKVH